MEIFELSPGGFASNCYLLKNGTDAVLIDCTADPDVLLAQLGNARLHAILLTHGHFDHMLSLAAVLVGKYPFFAHKSSKLSF